MRKRIAIRDLPSLPLRGPPGHHPLLYTIHTCNLKPSTLLIGWVGDEQLAPYITLTLTDIKVAVCHHEVTDSTPVSNGKWPLVEECCSQPGFWRRDSPRWCCYITLHHLHLRSLNVYTKHTMGMLKAHYPIDASWTFLAVFSILRRLYKTSYDTTK